MKHEHDKTELREAVCGLTLKAIAKLIEKRVD